MNPNDAEDLAPSSAGACPALDGFSAGAVANVHLTGCAGIVASVLDGGGISVVGVDASQCATVARLDTINVDITLALRAAVSAGAIEFSICVCVEVDNVDGTATIVLDDLVGGLVGTTSDDPGVLSGSVALDGDGVLANVLEPNELESARTAAVDTLSLVLSDDDVPQGSTSLEQEHSVSITTFSLVVASTRATIVLLPATIEDLTSIDRDHL